MKFYFLREREKRNKIEVVYNVKTNNEIFIQHYIQTMVKNIMCKNEPKRER